MSGVHSMRVSLVLRAVAVMRAVGAAHVVFPGLRKGLLVGRVDDGDLGARGEDVAALGAHAVAPRREGGVLAASRGVKVASRLEDPEGERGRPLPVDALDWQRGAVVGEREGVVLPRGADDALGVVARRIVGGVVEELLEQREQAGAQARRVPRDAVVAKAWKRVSTGSMGPRKFSGRCRATALAEVHIFCFLEAIAWVCVGGPHTHKSFLICSDRVCAFCSLAPAPKKKSPRRPPSRSFARVADEGQKYCHLAEAKARPTHKSKMKILSFHHDCPCDSRGRE